MSILVLSLARALAPASGSRVHGREPAPPAAQKHFDTKTAHRLYRITTPLLRAMEHSLKPQQVSIGIVADDAINAANGGGGKFILTTGLLERANDEQLRGVMAHEIAHEDLGHITRLKLSATGVNMVLLKQLATANTAVSLIEGPLITLGFSRSEENQADRRERGDPGAGGLPKRSCHRGIVMDGKRFDWIR